jgi:hypothetical protein
VGVDGVNAHVLVDGVNAHVLVDGVNAHVLAKFTALGCGLAVP